MEAVKKRDSNIELLRVIAMLMIIAHHFAVHGGFFFQERQITGNMLFLQWMSIGGKIGVNLFVLISGYFLAGASGIRVQKAVKLWLQIFFYSVVLFFLSCMTGLTDFSVRGLVDALFPILSRQWWFASSYFLMYLLSPLMNRAMGKLTQKKHLLLLAVLSVFWYGIPVFTWLSEQLRDLMWFLFLYCIAGYLRRYNSAEKQKAGTWLVIGTGLLLLSFGYAVFQLGFSAKYRDRYETAYFHTWQILMLVSAIPLLLGFVRLKVNNSSRINRLAAASFGIYLIHDSNYVRYFLWRELLGSAAYRDSETLIPYAIAAVILVYLVCLVLESIRNALLNGAFSALSQSADLWLKKVTIRRADKL